MGLHVIKFGERPLAFEQNQPFARCVVAAADTIQSNYGGEALTLNSEGGVKPRCKQKVRAILGFHLGWGEGSPF